MKSFTVLLIAVCAIFALSSSIGFARASDDFGGDMMFDAGANPSLCTCACECQRPKGSELLKQGAGQSQLTNTAAPVPVKAIQPVA